MIWALLVIPFVIALFIEYAINRSMLGKEVAIRSLLKNSVLFLLISAVVLGLFLLPQPWKNYISISVFTAVSVIAWLQILTWSRRKRQSGYLLWHLGWPLNHKYRLFVSVLFFSVAIMQTFWFVILEAKAFYSNVNIEYYLSLIILYWSCAFYCLGAGFSKLQLREKGIYFKFGLIKWQQIASYKWEGDKGNILTVWLKQPLPFFQTRSWSIPSELKNPVERIIVQNMSGQTKVSKFTY